MTAREHNRLLGIFFYIYLALQGVGLLIGIIGGIFFFGFFATQMGRNEEVPVLFVTIVMIVALAISALLLIPIGLAGYKISNEKPNAKLWGIIGSIVAILNIPLGTALGVYGLWFLLGEQGREIYVSGNLISSNVLPPPPNNWQ
jgi:hypothetical protein